MSCTRQAGSNNQIINDDDNNDNNNMDHVENELAYKQSIRKDLEEWRLSSVYSCNKRDRSPTIYDDDAENRTILDQIEAILATTKDTMSVDDVPCVDICNNSVTSLSSDQTNATRDDNDMKYYSSEI